MPISETLRRRKPRGRLPNMAAQRQKKVAWLVSHCHVHNKVCREAVSCLSAQMEEPSSGCKDAHEMCNR